MKLLVGCIIAHAVMAAVIPSPWWVPDLTLVGLVLAVMAIPSRWPLFAGLAGFSTMLWAIRFPQLILLAYGAVASGVAWLTGRLDLSDGRVQCITVAIVCGLLSLGALWLDSLWSWRLLGAVAARVLVTTLMVPLVRFLQ